MNLLATLGGELAALGGALLWAIASVLYRRVGEQVPPLELNLLKGILALAMLTLTLLLARESPASLEDLAFSRAGGGGTVKVYDCGPGRRGWGLRGKKSLLFL